MKIKVLFFLTMLCIPCSAKAAIAFGTTDYLTASDSSTLDITTDKFSINLWINGVSAGSGQNFVGKQNAASTQGYTIRVFATLKVRFTVVVGGVGKSVSSTTDFSSNAWHMLTGTYDGSNVRMYEDGVEDPASPLAASGNMTSSAGSILIVGRSVAANSYFASGSLDDVLILNYPLTAAQIKSLYGSRSHNIITPCQAHWILDSGKPGASMVGSTFYDVCGNGNTLTAGTQTGATLQMTPTNLRYP